MKPALCPCGSDRPFAACCGPYLDGVAVAPTAEALMRSRYSAYVQLNEDYLLATWHPTTRPAKLQLKETPQPRWIGLTVKHHETQGTDHATVAFVARHKVGGRAFRLEETSRFVREDGRWFYVDGNIGN